MARLSFSDPVTLIGAGPVDAAELSDALAMAPHLIGADGGADQAARLGQTPEYVIGDMDSITLPIPDGTERIHIADQGTTDLEKCLERIDAPLLIGVGFLGGRIDHTLASFHALLSHSERRICLMSDEDIVFAAPEHWEMAIDPGTRVSFFPIGACRGLRSSGLRWPIEGLAFEAGTLIGTSNEAVSSQISARFDGPGAVTILPRSCFEAALISLR